MADLTVLTDRDAFRAVAADAPDGARVPVEVRTTVADPFEAYRRARTGDVGAFLETTGGREGWGYFATDPVERLTVSTDAVRWRGREPADAPTDPDPIGTPSGERSPTFGELVGLLDRETLVRGDCEVPYPCGAFGWLSYDVARELESLPTHARDDRGFPRLQLAVFDRVAAWREPRDPDGATPLRVTVCPRVPAGAALDGRYDVALDRARDLVRAVHAGDPSVGPPPVDADAVRFESEYGRETFAERVRRAKRAIRDGETFQVNLSQRLEAPAAVHPVDAYAALRTVNPAPYSGLLEFPGVDLVSASPELLLHSEGDRLVTEPIAGTRPRGDTPEADRALETELRRDEKERAEHAMLVDLERNDLGKVARYGSVAVREYRRVDRYAEVMHLVTVVEGSLRADASLTDAVAAVFPGGTVTGAPKPRTMALIDELEDTRRGPYTGSVGVFGFDGRATLSIVIRTLVRRGDRYSLRVGAGVVHDSDPDSEYEETLAKGRALVTAIDEALAARGLAVAAGGEGDADAGADADRAPREEECGGTDGGGDDR